MAKYNLKKEFKKQSAISYFNKLLAKGSLIEIREIKSKRSISQNALYWLYLTCIEVETGTDRNYLHEYFKEQFIEPKKINVLGKVLEFRTTTNLDTKQFTDYLNRIVDFALMELSISMPNPDDKRLLEFYNEYKEYL